MSAEAKVTKAGKIWHNHNDKWHWATDGHKDKTQHEDVASPTWIGEVTEEEKAEYAQILEGLSSNEVAKKEKVVGINSKRNTRKDSGPSPEVTQARYKLQRVGVSGSSE